MNNLYKKILIATDGSEHTEKAITHAIELSKAHGSTASCGLCDQSLFPA